MYGQVGDEAPDVDEPERLEAFFAAMQALSADGKLLAYHDRSDGGLFVTLCEMMFAGAHGRRRRARRALAADDRASNRAALFNEELGAVLQVRAADAMPCVSALRACAGSRECVHVIGRVNRTARLAIRRRRQRNLTRARASSCTAHGRKRRYRMQQLRDNPQCARAGIRPRYSTRAIRGCTRVLTFDPADDVAAPFIADTARVRASRSCASRA